MAQDTRLEWWETLARAIRHPLRQQLLFKYAEGVESPSSAAKALGEPLNLVSYHTRVLLDAGCIELVRTARRRGATEHFYRTIFTSELGDAVWTELPEPIRRTLTRGLLQAAWREAGDALPCGGMDAATAHLSRSYFTLDSRGREELAALLKETLERAEVVYQASRGRRTGNDDAPCELVILSFERASRP